MTPMSGGHTNESQRETLTTGTKKLIQGVSTSKVGLHVPVDL
jgi:hypothetical protein